VQQWFPLAILLGFIVIALIIGALTLILRDAYRYSLMQGAVPA
jgi:hypothetical protein